jgi:RNA polymerase sigma factor (sigma-70 family)
VEAVLLPADSGQGVDTLTSIAPAWTPEVTGNPPARPPASRTPPATGSAGGEWLVAPAEEVDWHAVTRGIEAGDARSVQIFYEAHFDRLLVVAHRLTGRDEATCLDLVQLALLKAIRCLRPMADGQQLDRWLQVVLKTTAWDWLRRERRRREEPAGRSGEISLLAEASSTPTVVEDDCVRLAWIEEQLEQTEPELRRLLSLRYRLGWTLQQIARHCGLKTGAVDGRLRRAVQQLREQAQRDFPP